MSRIGNKPILLPADVNVTLMVIIFTLKVLRES